MQFIIISGDIILGLRNMDANWWEGRCGDQTGIFPVTHVVELDVGSSTQPVLPPPPSPGGSNPDPASVQSQSQHSTGQFENKFILEVQ